MRCARCGRNAVALFEGGLCSVCHKPKVAPKNKKCGRKKVSKRRSTVYCAKCGHRIRTIQLELVKCCHCHHTTVRDGVRVPYKKRLIECTKCGHMINTSLKDEVRCSKCLNKMRIE